MNLVEIKLIQQDTQAPVIISSLFDIDNYIVINNYVSLQIVNVSNSYDRNSPIPITLNSVVCGDLIFTKDKEAIKIDEMTDYEFISFLTYADFNAYNDEFYKFETDFILVKDDFILDYLSDYKNTSTLWGGFSHPLDSSLPSTRYKKCLSNIELGNKLRDFDDYSYESCVRAVEQPYAFERFLKLYHLLELQFDFFIINKIQSLQVPGDSNRIGKILNEYSHKELDRLTEIVAHYCIDIAPLEQILSDVSRFPTIAEDMFINFGKSSNPLHLGDPIKFRNVVQTGSFLISDLVRERVHGNTVPEHNKFIVHLCSYWIYRIRCSIAHNRIGEYILSWNDEDFIVEFGEPLLREVLMQCFKK